MSRNTTSKLVERLTRPQRLGIFGYRGVGKTTLITMLYREAVAGRLPGFRLAAADSRTADYLADKVAQLEAGERLPATLAETELRLNLYHNQTRIELIVKDYQGEHVELGRQESIHDFLRDCDAVWLCIDAAQAPGSRDLIRRQQEMEALIEDYLQVEPCLLMDRPFALILTKSDLVGAPADADWADQLSMTCHALETHCANSGMFAVSSLRCRASDAEKAGHGDAERRHLEHVKENGVRTPTETWRDSAEGTATEVVEVAASPRPRVSASQEEVAASPRPRVSASQVEASADASGLQLEPRNLAEPIGWLVYALQAQDEVRLGDVFMQLAHQPAVLARALDAFAKRHPGAACTNAYRQRLREIRRGRLRRKSLFAAGLAATLFFGLWAYDALGYQYMQHFESLNSDDPETALAGWQNYQQWHPTRHLLTPASEMDEKQRLAELAQAARTRARKDALTEIERGVELPGVNPEQLWTQLTAFHESYPEVNAEQTQALRDRIATLRAEEHARQARSAFEELVRAEDQQTIPLPELVARADDYLRRFADSGDASEVRVRRSVYLRRIDERDIEVARLYSAQHPLNFLTRREQYQAYLDKHPGGGDYSGEALNAIERIDREWDRHDFRSVRAHFVSYPADVDNLVPRCQSYLAAHPRGAFVKNAREILAFSERITSEHEYKVVLKKGTIDKDLGRTLSYGPDVSVELEVNGVRYGPSTIAQDTFEPAWDYEFPRRIRWKLGDPVRILVKDHDWSDRYILDIQPKKDYPLAMWYLAGPVYAGKNALHFESDFQVPVMPKID